MTEDELNRELLDKQIQYLSAMSPDDWHRVADVHNWDDPLDVLYWIVSQPNCDKATARLIFWKGEPTGYDFEDCDEQMGADSFGVEPMLAYIVRRFSGEGYARQEIEFDIFYTKTGCYEVDDKAYVASVENGIAADIEELKDRVPPDLLVRHSPGRRVGNHDGNREVFDTYPLGIDYDTGQFVYLY